MKEFADLLQAYFINDGRCLVGTLASAIFCAWLIWANEMRCEMQGDGKFWWLAPLGEVSVAFVIGAVFWPLGLVLMVGLALLHAFGGETNQSDKEVQKS